MNINDFQNYAGLVKHAVSKDDARPILQCLHAEFDDKRTHIVAADGFRLAHISFEGESLVGNYSFANKEIQDILKAKDKYKELPKLPEYEGEFPYWQQLIPDTSTRTSFMVYLGDLTAISKTLQECNTTKCFLKDDKLAISGCFKGYKDIIMFQTEIAVESLDLKAEYTKFAINPKYVFDFCKALSKSPLTQVGISIGTPSDPIVFRHPYLEEIIMPMFAEWQ